MTSDRRRRLEHDRRSAAPDNAKEDIVRFGPLKRDIEPETVTIKREGGGDIVHNEDRRNAGDFWFSHASFQAGLLTAVLEAVQQARRRVQCGSQLCPGCGAEPFADAALV